jgi:nucleoside-diphosphate-sugar epimerase
LFTSTSEVYGDALEHPQKESYYGNVNPFGTRSCYDESKRIGESLVYTYQKMYNLNTRIVRIFNTYGPYMCLSDGRIVTEIIKSMFKENKLVIFGDGNQTRSLSFAPDTVKMIVKVMHSDYSEPVNVGNEDEIDINTLVEMSKSVYHTKYNKQANMIIAHQAIDKDDPKVRRPCLDKYRSLFGEPPRTSLYKGLFESFDYFEGTLNENS